MPPHGSQEGASWNVGMWLPGIEKGLLAANSANNENHANNSNSADSSQCKPGRELGVPFLDDSVAVAVISGKPLYEHSGTHTGTHMH